MNLKTAVLVTKGLCYLAIGVFTPWAASLAQWSNSGEWPSKIIWLGVILPASVVGGASQLLSFLSSSFGKYEEEKKVEQKQKDDTTFLVKSIQAKGTE